MAKASKFAALAEFRQQPIEPERAELPPASESTVAKVEDHLPNKTVTRPPEPELQSSKPPASVAEIDLMPPTLEPAELMVPEGLPFLNVLADAPQPRAVPSSRPRGRPPGKRSDPEWKLYSHFLRRQTQRQATAILFDMDDGQDLSDVLQSLLEKWVARQRAKM